MFRFPSTLDREIVDTLYTLSIPIPMIPMPLVLQVEPVDNFGNSTSDIICYQLVIGFLVNASSRLGIETIVIGSS
jgi:hypothetical protein